MRAQLPTGAVVAGFRIESLLGEGAMGSVFVAEDTRRGGRVALKVLAPELTRDERFRERFLRESRIAGGLDHPNIVPTVDSGEENGVLYLAMELVEGFDLRELLRREGRLTPERALALLSQAADALDAAHRAGLVHRDVKPGNILVAPGTDGESAFVCDFGLARHVSSVSSLTGDHGFVGTIDYVPPEQIEGGPIDGRADVYALGCVLFECFAGQRPFVRESELSVVFAHLNEPPPRLSDLRSELPAAFDGVFATALAKPPDDRYSSCTELMEAARAAARGKVVGRRRRRRKLIAVAVAALVAGGAAIGGVLAAEGGSTSAGPPAITQTSIAGAPLGLRVAGYTKILGEPDFRVDQPKEVKGFPSTEYPTLVFLQQKVAVYFPDGWNSNAKIITTWNKNYKTAAGIGPCSTIDELKGAYGDNVRPDPFATIGKKHFLYDVDKNLLFAAAGPPHRPPVPWKYVSAVGLFNGSAPHADERFGARPFGGFVTGNETPRCIP